MFTYLLAFLSTCKQLMLYSDTLCLLSICPLQNIVTVPRESPAIRSVEPNLVTSSNTRDWIGPPLVSRHNFNCAKWRKKHIYTYYEFRKLILWRYIQIRVNQNVGITHFRHLHSITFIFNYSYNTQKSCLGLPWT